ncbi:MAG: Bax inhibitor-1/YccA family protein [Chitinophagales bacterium]|nr:Bax inhibitor-1/YccA family protein [Chitinophagales bacterium]
MNYTILEEEKTNTTGLTRLMGRVYGWMGAALLISALSSLLFLSSETALQLVFGNRIGFWVLIILEFLLVIGISGAINRISASTATALFILYAILNGITLSPILLIYTGASVAATFFITAATFGVMSIAGYVTKKDLSTMGSYLIMGLIGVIIASVVNMFLHSETMDYIISYLGVFIFIGLTAYDTQKIKTLGQEAINNGASMQKIAILGALTLYLDFVNLFLYLLRLFGRRK